MYVVCGVFLGAVGIYGAIVDFAGAGATTPLTGFGYLIAKGVREAVDEKGLLGALTGGLSAAAGGTAAALVFGFLAALLFRGFLFFRDFRFIDKPETFFKGRQCVKQYGEIFFCRGNVQRL